jgi:hypothetical protein
MLDVLWNVLHSLPYNSNMPISRDSLKRMQCRRLYLHDCYDLLVQDMGHEDLVLNACVRDLLMPYTITRETLPDFYCC